MISEAMNINTTLTELNLDSDKIEERNDMNKPHDNNVHEVDNKIGVEGTRVLSETLKANATLTKLSLSGDIIKMKESMRTSQ